MKQFIKLAAFVCAMLIANSSVGQEIIDGETKSYGELKYTLCYDKSKKKPNLGAKVNGKLVVPCNYREIYCYGDAFLAYKMKTIKGRHYTNEECEKKEFADVFLIDGELLFPETVGISHAKNWYISGNSIFRNHEDCDNCKENILFFTDWCHNYSYDITGKKIEIDIYLNGYLDGVSVYGWKVRLIQGKYFFCSEGSCFTKDNGYWFNETGKKLFQGLYYEPVVIEGKIVFEYDNDYYDEMGKHLGRKEIIQSKVYFVDKEDKWYDVNGKFFVKGEKRVIQGKYYFRDSDNKWYDVNGKFLVKGERREIQGKTYFKDSDNKWYDANGKFLVKGEKREIQGKTYFKGNDDRWYDMDGKFVVKGYELLFSPSGEVYGKTRYEGKYGISTSAGVEILAPEFQDCAVLGNDLFSFKMNGYWGVINKVGAIIIPISRQYSSISYSRTLKMFTFEKRVDNVVYKGECDATGKQLSIQKDHTINTSPVQKSKETKPKKDQKTEPTPKPKEEKKPEPAPQPQPRQPQPMQVWVYCGVCGGSGQCIICNGLGWRMLANKQTTCSNCGGSGRCNGCAGQGGHNEVKYY